MSDKQTREQAVRYTEMCDEYTNEFEKQKLVEDWLRKEAVADALMSDFIRRAGELSGRRVLELGFGSGLYIPAFVKAGAEVYGLEVNEVLLEIAENNMRERGIAARLQLYDGDEMPYSDTYFDYVFSVSVLEHVTDMQAVIREMNRVLKVGGRAYISFPNRLAPRETHTGFWCVHYLPRLVAARIYTLLGSNAVEDINLHFLTYFSLRRALRGTGLSVVFETQAQTMFRRIIKRTFSALGIHHSAFLKTVMVILEKQK